MSIAFFDVDGTLLPHPSLESRFFWNLVRQGKIPATNYLRWITQMFRIGATNLATAAQSNKMYLSRVPTSVLSPFETLQDRWIPAFFPAAIQRVWSHALHGDEIVLVSGTLAPLADIVKAALERELLCRGVETLIAVLATRLVAHNGRWTGSISGAPMFGETKRKAAKEFASSRGVALAQCSAYGDHALDRSLLETVGNPVAVNPTPGLRRIANQNGWQAVCWRPYPQRTADVRHPLQWKGEVAR